jgi:hypothetical protein
MHLSETHFRCWVVFSALLCGCNQRPSNPVADVLANPPEVVDITAHSEVAVNVNGQPALGETVSVANGEEVKMDVVLVRKDQGTLPFSSMLFFRVLPDGAAGKEWASDALSDEFVVVPDLLTGKASVDTNTKVRAAPGKYQYRCYIFYHFANGDQPRFDLISKGSFVVVGND